MVDGGHQIALYGVDGGLVGWGAHQHPQVVRRMGESRVGLDRRLAGRDPVVPGQDRRHHRRHPDGVLARLPGIPVEQRSTVLGRGQRQQSGPKGVERPARTGGRGVHEFDDREGQPSRGAGVDGLGLGG